MSEKRHQFIFRIDAFTPETIPMARLAEYLVDLSALMGNQESVHFLRLKGSSTSAISEVENEAVPKVAERLEAVKNQDDAPEDALRAYRSIDEKLRSDNASGDLTTRIDGKPKILSFPGKKRIVRPVYGPFTEEGSLDGILIRVGGQEDSVPVHLQDADESIHICYAKRSIAKSMAPFIYSNPIRVSGMGRWIRDAEGIWIMKRFTIRSFKPLKNLSLEESLIKLRKSSKSLSSHPDILDEMIRLRHGSEGG